MKNRLYIGDNLTSLRGLDSETVDLIYLDPPFNSTRTYHGSGAAAKAKFSDVWRWDDEVKKHSLDRLMSDYPNLVQYIRSVKQIHSGAMAGYLLFMTLRLIELHRVLKPTGSLYLHCDPTASHYLKVILDRIFGAANFRNEIVWQRTKSNKSSTKQFARNTDTIFFYTKTEAAKFAPQFGAPTAEALKRFNKNDGDGRGAYGSRPLDDPRGSNYHYQYKGYPSPEKGWRCPESTMEQYDRDRLLIFPKSPSGRITRKNYLSDYKGTPLSNNWTDIGALQAADKERTGWPTQKPVALLKRIISASSNPGDLVLDPFAGCGTSTIAAELLGRRWIGMDWDEETPKIMQILRDKVGMSMTVNTYTPSKKPPRRSDLTIIRPRAAFAELYGLQKGDCAGCGKHKEAEDLEVDHIIPRSHNGLDCMENYQLLCSTCNRIKGARPMEYLMRRLELMESARAATTF